MTTHLKIEDSLNSATFFSCIDKAIGYIHDTDPSASARIIPLKADEEASNDVKLIAQRQEEFFKFYGNREKARSFLASATPEELQNLGISFAALASKKASEVNKLMADNGFNIRLNDVQTKTGFCVGSAIKYVTKWKSKGKKSVFSDEKLKDIKAFELENDTNNQLFKWNDRYVAKLATTTGLEFWIMETNAKGLGIWRELDNLEYAFNKNQLKLLPNWESMRFPILKHNSEIDIHWIEGAQFEASPNNYEIEEAKQEIDFEMDEEGSSGGAGTAMRIEVRGIQIPLRYEFDSNLIVGVYIPNVGWVFEVKVEFPVFNS